jgi:DNA-directed RNA polymerase sigma subunit (sigma70/sigma32)
MEGKKFEMELKLVEDALEGEQGRNALKEYLRPLVESVASRYSSEEPNETLTKARIIKAGWVHLDFALKKYKENADVRLEEGKTPFLFSTYFTWHVRQGIVEYLKALNK